MPLFSIQCASDALRRYLSEQKALELHEITNINIILLTTMINDILDYSKINK